MHQFFGDTSQLLFMDFTSKFYSPGFFIGWASFQEGLKNFAIYIPFYSSLINIKMQTKS